MRIMQYDVTIIGGGIVGLASAYRILEQNPTTSLCLLEKEDAVAKHQTGHNSGVIHSGIYYKPGSLKAQNCIKGYQQLLEFAQQHNIPHEICGKVIVATKTSELQALDNICKRGIDNGLTGIRKLQPKEVSEIEPHVSSVAGILVPQTGIIDYVMMAGKLKELIENKGGKILTGEKVASIHTKSESTIIRTNTNEFATRFVINCAGLYSDKIAQMTGQAENLQILPFRGEYFFVKPDKAYLVKNLIYPVPNPNFPFLGVHFTRMIHGGLEAGPNAVLAFKREGYKKSDIDFKELWEILKFPGFHKIMLKYWKEGLEEMYRSWSKAAFTKALQQLIPEIESDDLVPGGAGVRAQTCDSEGNLSDDFLIFDKGRTLNICNAPSPAATSSLSIGSSIAASYFKNIKQ
jgi:L-2-hydroxyglutarate oxidase